MGRTGLTILLIAAAVATAVLGQRLAGNDLRPAAAREAAPQPLVASVVDGVPGSIDRTLGGKATELAARSAERSVADASVAEQPSSGPAAVTPSTADSAETALVPAAPPPARTPVPAVAAPTAAPVATPAPPVATPAPPIATPAPTSCPATWFCYPRLGVSGPIVPYSDCSGSTDIGTSIRSFTCLSPFYLMGHAYTQFGQITQWRAGDVVFASGRSFVITGAFTQSSCAAPARAVAPLSLQTSLTSGGCGSVLVVQGN